MGSWMVLVVEQGADVQVVRAGRCSDCDVQVRDFHRKCWACITGLRILCTLDLIVKIQRDISEGKILPGGVTSHIESIDWE